MTKHEILDKIATTYNSENRSVNGTKCLYNGPDGKVCAFAMMVKPEARHKLIETAGVYGLITTGTITQEDLLPEYAGHEPEFYSDCQALHDIKPNWDSSGLSPAGREMLKYFREDWPQ